MTRCWTRRSPRRDREAACSRAASLPPSVDLVNPASWPRFRFRAPVFAVAALAAVALAAWLMNYVARYDFIPPERQGVAVPPALQQALDTDADARVRAARRRSSRSCRS